jgi:hypothetical protein
MGKKTIEIDIPDDYELAEKFISIEGDKIIGIGYKLKTINFDSKGRIAYFEIYVPNNYKVINDELFPEIDCLRDGDIINSRIILRKIK